MAIKAWSPAAFALGVMACLATAAETPVVTVIESDAVGFAAWFDCDGFDAVPRKTSAGEFLELRWPNASITGEIGAPGLPVVRRLFVAPPGAVVTVRVSLGTARVSDLEAEGLPWRVMPVQLPVPKLPGARERAVFQYDETAYATAPVRSDRAVVEEVGIVRGQRLFLLEVRPIDYDPVARTLVFWPELEVDVKFTGGRAVDTDLSPAPGMRRIVLNPDQLPQVARRGSGNYLIIVAQTFDSAIAPFAAAKSAQGFTVTTHSIVPGTSRTAIKSYIESLWGTPDTPDYILLVGDTNTIPHWAGEGYDTPDNDLQYTCMDGVDDWVPDIALGRFPVRTTDQLQAMIDKTLYYEEASLADPSYKRRAMLWASSDEHVITEGTHNYVIDTWLEPHWYECDKLYQSTYNAKPQNLRDSLNDGRIYGIYSGHGLSTCWEDERGTVFGKGDINDLTNEDMYAAIYSFACLTGDYANYDECFMESWVRAPDKGAVTACGASVSSYWDMDDILQRRMSDAIFDNEDGVKTEIAPIYNEAKLCLLAHFGADSYTRAYFEMYNLMGDPSFPLPSGCSDAGEIWFAPRVYRCEDTARIRVVDCGLNLDDDIIETVIITVDSDSELTGETVILYESGCASAQFEGSIGLSETNAPGVLWVAPGDTVSATYLDTDNGRGSINVAVVAIATVDCAPPVISNVQATDIGPYKATIVFDVDEPVRSTVRYGLSCDSLTWEVSDDGCGYTTSPVIELTGLEKSITYYYTVEAEDKAGNSITSNNGGACHNFITLEFFTERFYADDNDLDNLKLIFTPDGSNNFYSGCVEEITELPTDPTGGASLTFAPNNDDGFATINLSGGDTVSLYGQSYGTFYPGCNGYITFTNGDIDPSESIEDHFDTPRISALFDDLDPGAGGTATWKQLENRVVVTWLDVPECSKSNENTFQIEMFFDGTITISYLDVSVTDGLAGLSDGNGEHEEFLESDLSELGSCESNLVGSTPLHEVSLWRTANNFVRLTFDADIMTPANGELLIEVMLPGGAFGTSYTIATDDSADFKVEVVNDGYGNPRILEIWENGSVLTHTDWIAVRSAGGWVGVAKFHRHCPVMKGDVDFDGDVLPTDFGPMFPKIPTFGSDPDERADVDGNRDVLPTDFGPMFPYIPTFGDDYPKPPGHLP